MLRTLVTMVHDMGTSAIAEGVETKDESECCSDLGFDFLQGYLYGKPQPVDSFAQVAIGEERHLAPVRLRDSRNFLLDD